MPPFAFLVPWMRDSSTSQTQESEVQGSLVPITKQDARLLLESGYLCMDMGQFEEARDIFVGCAALMPKNDAPQLAIGTLEFSQGKHQKALQAYRAAQKLSPRSGLPRAYAGETLPTEISE